MRVVHYAINGRGMGHLVRQVAIARWMRRYAAVLGRGIETWVLTTSEADTLARREGLLSLKIPSKSTMRDAGVDPSRFLAIARSWVVQTLAGLQPDLLVVDTFPAGSFGELIAALELVPHRALVARAVRDDVGQQAGWQALLPLYQRHITPEDGGVGPVMIRERSELNGRDEVRRELGLAPDARAVWVSLGGGGDPAASGALPRLVDALRERGLTVIVAAGPLYEGPERRGPGVIWLDRYVAMELLPGVDVAVSAGGYNAFHELMYAGVPTVFLPQPRIADDQESRVAAAVAAGAAAQAAALEAVPDAVLALLAKPGAAEAAAALVPDNGARRAAAAALSLLVPEADLRAAVAAFPPSLLGAPAARSLAPGRLVELIRRLAPEPASAWQTRRAAGLELIDRGLLSGHLPSQAPAGAPADQLLATITAEGWSPDAVAEATLALGRKWPAAGGAELLEASLTLYPALHPFDDPSGAAALLRALPSQRTWSVGAAATALAAWLPSQGDLFDAQRALLRAAASGRRTLAEALVVLAQATSPDDGALL